MDEKTIDLIINRTWDNSDIHYWINPKDNACNATIEYKGKKSRLRAGIMIIKDDEILLGEEADEPGVFSLPGGGLEKGETPVDAAVREAQEEVYINVKDAQDTGIDYCECHTELKDWVKENVPEKEQWYNYYTCLIIGEYDSEYKGKVDKVDQDKAMDSSAKWYKISAAITNPSFKDAWKLALVNYDYIDKSLVEKIVKKGSQYQVQSEKGRNMGTYPSMKQAKKRLQQIEFFKHMNEDKEEKLYHVSEKPLTHTIYPEIPESDYEEQETPRICFAKTIQGCLIGAYENEDITGKVLHVYSTISDYYQPTKEEVADVEVTGEVWVLHDVDPTYEYDIKIIGKDGSKQFTINNETFDIPIWKYEIIKDLDEALDHNRLYHKTTLNNSLHIIYDNTLKIGGNYFYNIKNGQCVCLSRSLDFVKKMPGNQFCIFVLNKEKLASDYQIIPMSDDKNNTSGATMARYESSKAEEVVKRNITNLTKYLDKVIIDDIDYDRFIAAVNKYVPECKIQFVKMSEYKVNEQLNEATITQNFELGTAGFIREDGSLVVVDEYHGEDNEYRNSLLPEYSNTHPEDDTCIRVYKEPNQTQYDRIENIIDRYLDAQDYCKIEIWTHPLEHYTFYKTYSLYEGACESAENEEVGNWTGYKLVQVIKNYFNRSLTESTRNQLIAKTKSGSAYKDKTKGNRWDRKKYCKIANTVKDYNKIDMDTFWKHDILKFKVRVAGETATYYVTVEFNNILARIQQRIKANKNKLEIKCIYDALLQALNSSDVKVECNCGDFRYRLNYWLSQHNEKSGEKETRASKITNPKDNLGAVCKHIAAVLNNADWLNKIASVINNYVSYCKENMQYNYSKYIFPKLYGMEYKKAVQMCLNDYDENGNVKDKLESDEELINLSNALGKERGKIKPGSNKNPVAQQRRKEQEKEEEAE